MAIITRIALLASFLGFAVASFAAPYPDTIGPAINLGRASLFSVVTQGSMSMLDDTITGPSYVKGNIAIGGTAKFSMSDGSVDGDLWVRSTASYALSGPARINGHIYHDAAHDNPIDNAIADAISLSQSAAMDTSTGNYTVTQGTFNGSTVNSGNSISILGTGKVVLNLQDFVMTSGTFTLQGTASTTFIINVARNFSLNNSSVVLSGVPSSNVLFNILGTGSQVSLNQGTQLSGILVAMGRKVDLSGGKVFGRVYGNQVNITSGGQVVSQ